MVESNPTNLPKYPNGVFGFFRRKWLGPSLLGVGLLQLAGVVLYIHLGYKSPIGGEFGDLVFLLNALLLLLCFSLASLLVSAIMLRWGQNPNHKTIAAITVAVNLLLSGFLTYVFFFS
jgi:hypothetical protein